MAAIVFTQRMDLYKKQTNICENLEYLFFRVKPLCITNIKVVDYIRSVWYVRRLYV